MAKINSELEKDFMRNMELRAELSRMSYEATGGVRENYRNNENPNVNLGGQEALQQFKKINIKIQTKKSRWHINTEQIITY